MNQDTQTGMKLVNANVDQIQVFLITKQRQNEDKCRCECRELIDKERLIWNLSNSKCKCDRSCDVREYLDYENCKCRKRLVDKLIEECSENIDEVKIARITLAGHENEYKNKCKFF